MPHCKKTRPPRAFILAERTKRFLETQNISAKKWLTLDYDVIYMVFRLFDTNTLKSLTYFAGIWRYEAHRRLLHTLDYNAHICTPPAHPDDAPWMTCHYALPSRTDLYRSFRNNFNELAFKCCSPERRRIMYRGLRPTFVRDVRSLCDFLKHNEELYEFVRNAFLRRDADSYDETDTLIRKLETSGALESLHITGLLRPNFNYTRPSSNILTSVHVDFSIATIARTFTPTHLRLLFQSPGLRSVHLSHFQYNSDQASYSKNIAPRTSSVTQLVLTDILPQDVALAAILRWPRALISLHIEVTPEVDFEAFGLSIQEFFDSVSFHKTTLTHLHLGSLQANWDIELFRPDLSTLQGTISLRNFTALKTLDIPFCALAQFPLEEMQYIGNGAVIDDFFAGISDTTRLLPTSLEKLTIRLGQSFTWRQRYGVGAGNRPRSLLRPLPHATGFFDWLNDLCRDRAKRFNMLKEVKVLCIASRVGDWGPLRQYHEYMQAVVAITARNHWATKGVKLDFRVRDQMERTEREDAGEAQDEDENWPAADWQ